MEPPASPGDRIAPGEDAVGLATAVDDDDRLFGMLSAARADASLRPVVRDPRLDAIARSHALRMATDRDLSHDAVEMEARSIVSAPRGSTREDLGEERVAHAAGIALAHRALWASPSHRANLLGSVRPRGGRCSPRRERRYLGRRDIRRRAAVDASSRAVVPAWRPAFPRR